MPPKKQPPFTAIPNDIVDMIPVIGVYAFTLYTYLKRRMNKNNECWPSYSRMQEDLGLSRPCISKAIDILLEHGLIEKRRRFSKSTVYSISKLNLLMEPPVVNETYSSSKLNLPPLVNETYSNKNQLTRTIEEEDNDDDPSFQNNTIYQELSTAFCNATQIPELTGGAPNWMKALETMAKAGVTGKDIEDAVEELNGNYNIVRLSSIINPAIKVMSARKQNEIRGQKVTKAASEVYG